jgi:hypothetical protein
MCSVESTAASNTSAAQDAALCELLSAGRLQTINSTCVRAWIVGGCVEWRKYMRPLITLCA